MRAAGVICQQRHVLTRPQAWHALQLFHQDSTARTNSMPRNKGKSTKDSSNKEPPTPNISGPIKKQKNGSFCISVLAKPGAKQNAITDISPEGIGVQVAAPATEGAANAELTEYLASVVGVRKREVSLVRGMKSRSKVFTATADSSTSVDDMIARFKTEVENG